MAVAFLLLALTLRGTASAASSAGTQKNEPAPYTDRLGDPLPPGAIARLGTMRLRHDGPVATVVFAPNGKTLASGGDDGTIRIWETASGREMRCLRGQQDKVCKLVYSPDGKLLASAGASGGIILWDPSTGAKLDRLGAENEQAFSLAFAPDGKTLAAGTGGTVVWWDVATGIRLRSLDGVHNTIASVAYSPDGKTLAYASVDETIGLCDPATGKAIRNLSKTGIYPAPYRPSVAYSPDGKKLLVADKDCWRLLDAATGKELRQDDGPPSNVPPAYAPNGRSIATMSWALKGHPCVWDLARNKEVELRSKSQVNGSQVVVFSPDSKLLASGGEDGRVRLWDVAARKEVDLPAGDARGRGAFALSRDGKILAAMDGNGRIRGRETACGKILHQWNAPTNEFPFFLGMSPDGSQLVVPGKNATLQVVDATTGHHRWHVRAAEAIQFAAYSPDGKLLAASGDKNVDLWDAATGRRLGRLEGHSGDVVVAVFSPDGKSLVTASEDHTVRVWDMARRRERHRLKGHGGGVTVSRIVFSADGTRLATGGDDGRICVWDAHTGRRLHRWAIAEEEDMTGLAMSADGKTLVADVTCLALSADGTALVANAGADRFCLWDVATGAASPPIEGHRGAITFAAFQPDGRTLLTAGRDGTALVWDRTALQRRRPPPRAPVRTDANGDPLPPNVLARLGSTRLRHDARVPCAVYSPDGKILASAPEWQELRLWDAASGKEIHRLSKGRGAYAHQIAFSPNGKVLATLSDRGIQLWDVASGVSLGTAIQLRQDGSCFAFAPDGKTLAIAGSTMSLWDLDTGDRLRIFDEMLKWVDQIVFTPDGKTILAVRKGNLQPDTKPFPGVLGVWDVATGKRRQRFEFKSTLLALAPGGRTFVYLDPAKRLHGCAGATGVELWQSKNEGSSCLFSPDGKHLLTGERGQPFRLRESATGKEVRRSPATLPFRGAWLCLSPDCETLAMDGITLWDVASGRQRTPFVGHSQGVTCLDFAPDGRTLVSGSKDGTLRLWDALASKEFRIINGSQKGIKAVAFSPDGKTIASGDSRNVVRLWATATGKELWRFEGRPSGDDSGKGGMQSVVFSSDGRTLIAGSVDGMIYLWDAVTHKLRQRFKGCADWETAVVVSSDGRLLARAGKHPGNRMRLWEATTREGVGELTEARPALAADVSFPVAFSPDGKLLAGRRYTSDPPSSGQFCRICFWERATGKELFHVETIEDVAGFSADGQYLITTDGVLWDMGTGKAAGQLSGSSRRIDALAVSPDGRMLATGSDDATILIQPLPRAPRRKTLLTHEPSADELGTIWTKLSARDPAQAWPAMRILIETPRQSVPFLRTVLRPHPPIDRQRLERLLVDLDSEQFLVRERARKEVGAFGELAEPALRRTLTGKPSLEVRRQVLALLERVEKAATSPDALRILRVTTVLERIGTAESVELLRRLAGGAAEARLTREAAAAVERLTRRTVRP